MLQKDEKTIQELKNELADRKEELNAANRKLHTLREDGLAPQHSLPLPVTPSSLSSVDTVCPDTYVALFPRICPWLCCSMHLRKAGLHALCIHVC